MKLKTIKKNLPFATKRKLHQQKELNNERLKDSKVLVQERSQLYEELNKKNNEAVGSSSTNTHRVEREREQSHWS